MKTRTPLLADEAGCFRAWRARKLDEDTAGEPNRKRRRFTARGRAGRARAPLPSKQPLRSGLLLVCHRRAPSKRPNRPVVTASSRDRPI
uniref:Uncharacterized protein n=1 Tax=Plectus sambesii TaxID=2011161 RepID=A0A914WEM5_9BILA